MRSFRADYTLTTTSCVVHKFLQHRPKHRHITSDWVGRREKFKSKIPPATHTTHVQHAFLVLTETCPMLWNVKSSTNCTILRWHIKNLLFCRFSRLCCSCSWGTRASSVSFFSRISLIIHPGTFRYLLFVIFSFLQFLSICMFIWRLNFNVVIIPRASEAAKWNSKLFIQKLKFKELKK